MLYSNGILALYIVGWLYSTVIHKLYFRTQRYIQPTNFNNGIFMSAKLSIRVTSSLETKWIKLTISLNGH